MSRSLCSSPCFKLDASIADSSASAAGIFGEWVSAGARTRQPPVVPRERSASRPARSRCLPRGFALPERRTARVAVERAGSGALRDTAQAARRGVVRSARRDRRGDRITRDDGGAITRDEGDLRAPTMAERRPRGCGGRRRRPVGRVGPGKRHAQLGVDARGPRRAALMRQKAELSGTRSCARSPACLRERVRTLTGGSCVTVGRANRCRRKNRFVSSARL